MLVRRIADRVFLFHSARTVSSLELDEACLRHGIVRSLTPDQQTAFLCHAGVWGVRDLPNDWFPGHIQGTELCSDRSCISRANDDACGDDGHRDGDGARANDGARDGGHRGGGERGVKPLSRSSPSSHDPLAGRTRPGSSR